MARCEPSANSAATKAEQLLRSRIQTGMYAAKERLPAERALAAELGIHRGAVRTAIDRLAAAGFVHRKACCRPVVAAGVSVGGVVSRRNKNPPGKFAATRFVALVMARTGFDGAPIQQRIFWSLNQALSRHGYYAALLDLGDEAITEEENAKREESILRYALAHSFAGIVAYTRSHCMNRPVLLEAAHERPLVLIDHLIAGVEADYAGAQNFDGMRMAAEHLIGLGHRRIAYVTSAEPINTVQDRLEGYRSAMRGAGLVPRVLLAGNEPECAELDSEWRRPITQRPTAILCLNDWIALLLFNRLALAGLAVPGDISLVGFDDIVHTLPNGIGLTTIAQPFEQIGSKAAELLLCRLRLPSAFPTHIELPTTLMPRASSAAPAD